MTLTKRIISYRGNSIWNCYFNNSVLVFLPVRISWWHISTSINLQFSICWQRPRNGVIHFLIIYNLLLSIYDFSDWILFYCITYTAMKTFLPCFGSAYSFIYCIKLIPSVTWRHYSFPRIITIIACYKFKPLFCTGCSLNSSDTISALMFTKVYRSIINIWRMYSQLFPCFFWAIISHCLQIAATSKQIWLNTLYTVRNHYLTQTGASIKQIIFQFLYTLRNFYICQTAAFSPDTFSDRSNCFWKFDIRQFSTGIKCICLDKGYSTLHRYGLYINTVCERWVSNAGYSTFQCNTGQLISVFKPRGTNLIITRNISGSFNDKLSVRIHSPNDTAVDLSTCCYISRINSQILCLFIREHIFSFYLFICSRILWLILILSGQYRNFFCFCIFFTTFLRLILKQNFFAFIIVRFIENQIFLLFTRPLWKCSCSLTIHFRFLIHFFRCKYSSRKHRTNHSTG